MGKWAFKENDRMLDTWRFIDHRGMVHFANDRYFMQQFNGYKIAYQLFDPYRHKSHFILSRWKVSATSELSIRKRTTAQNNKLTIFKYQSHRLSQKTKKIFFLYVLFIHVWEKQINFTRDFFYFAATREVFQSHVLVLPFRILIYRST